MEFVRLGEYAGPKTERLEQVAEIWRSGGFKVLTFDDIHKMVWEKLTCNVAFSGPCTLTGLTIGQVRADASGFFFYDSWSTEFYTVARAKGIASDIDDPVTYVSDFSAKIPNARPSMLLDHMAGRRCEIDVINGAIPREGARLGVPTPVNVLVCALVRAKETTFG